MLAADHDADAGVASRRPGWAGRLIGRWQPGVPAGGWLLLAGSAALALSLALYAAAVASHPAGTMLSWFDLRVYQQAGVVVRHAPASLYSWQYQPHIRFTYTPFAAVAFAVMSVLPWPVVAWSMLAASLLALVATAWLAFGALGWQGCRRAGAAMAVSAVALWTEPVERALHLGQVELLLMALIVADLTGPQRWWRGTGIGLAAGLKLVPLIFIPYLLLTRRLRQAVVATATFAALAAAGFAVLPQASVQWWLGPDFLRPGRTGFVPMVANQSLRALAARVAGSMAASGGPWLVSAIATGAVGLLVAAALHRAGRPVAGWTVCALTGLLVSPVSWDHHWVWLTAGLVVVTDLAAGARGAARCAWWTLAGALALIFGGWPSFWEPGSALVPVGLIWFAPDLDATGRHAEYSWRGVEWVAGNLYLLAGIALLAGVTAIVVRGLIGTRRPAPAGAPPVPLAGTGN